MAIVNYKKQQCKYFSFCYLEDLVLGDEGSVLVHYLLHLLLVSIPTQGVASNFYLSIFLLILLSINLLSIKVSIFSFIFFYLSFYRSTYLFTYNVRTYVYIFLTNHLYICLPVIFSLSMIRSFIHPPFHLLDSPVLEF